MGRSSRTAVPWRREERDGGDGRRVPEARARPDVAAVLALQRSAGNAVATAVLARAATPVRLIQREPDPEKVKLRAHQLWERKGRPPQTSEQQDADYFEAQREVTIEERAYLNWEKKVGGGKPQSEQEGAAEYFEAEQQLADEAIAAVPSAGLGPLMDAIRAQKDEGLRQSKALELAAACDRALAGELTGEAAAKVRVLRRRAIEIGGASYAAAAKDGLPTFDTQAEQWTTAAAPGSGTESKDPRRFPEAEAGGSRQREVFRTLADVTSIEDIDRLDPTQIRDINPQSIIPYRILTTVLHESWHVAKELLLDPAAPNQNRRALMTKLWEYRQWHHQEILKEVMEVLNAEQGDVNALKESKGAGSATLSSDIDVNLKGTHTELAVRHFNEIFKQSRRLPAHRFTNEPGVVYDVNVYAIDFMHKYGANELPSGRRTTQKEGAREGRPEGGVGDQSLQALDRSSQLVTSLFKGRVFMTQAQWSAYRAATVRSLPVGSRAELEAAFRAADFLFAGYLREMSQRMGVRLAEIADKAESGVAQLKAAAATKVPGAAHDHAIEAQRENVLMVAANRIYEDKLQGIHAQRAKLKTLIADHQAAPPERRSTIEVLIDSALLQLRRNVAEAAMYANEASMTDATIHHGVVGIQGGQRINQQKAEGINAVNEHLADVMKEAARYGPELGPAAYKAGKYLMRLGDAAKNLGYGYIAGVQTLYRLGHALSEYIKVEAERGGFDYAAESARAVKAITGFTTLDDLLKLVMDTAADVMQEYSQERAAHQRHGDPDTATAYGHQTGPKKSLNVHVLNQEMVHPADRSPGKRAAMQVEPREFTFRLDDEEREALEADWATRKQPAAQ